MGILFDVILTVPYCSPRDGDAVDVGLRELGFTPAPDGFGRGDDDRDVWLRLSQKLPRVLNLDGLRDAVLALPWRRAHVEQHLMVLHRDEFSTGDDSWGGRKAPFAWSVDTWVVPSS